MSALEAKAHELLGHLEPYKLAAVVQLLEVMIEADSELVTKEDRRRFRKGKTWFSENPGGIPMDEVLADFGLKPGDFPLK